MFFDIHHLKNSKIGFLSHSIRVLRMSVVLIVLGVVGIIHAFLPFIFTKTVSNGIKKLYAQVKDF
jgi:hypothetical protein|tara:strand:+ start:59 stop:253 length:195 start_codon:yes stop_codon:yes gene_type:complete